MAFKLVYTKKAVKDIKRLDRVTQKKLKKKIELSIKKPLFYAKKLIDYKLGEYRWRVGNYRIVFDIDGRNIVVLRVGHRREIYK